MRARIRWGLLGGGPGSLIGSVHRIAASMAGDYQLMGGVFSSGSAATQRAAQQWDLNEDRAYPSLDELIRAELARATHERMQVITIATPNHLHFDMARRLIECGFHLVCEKPITTTAEQARELARLLQSRRQVFAVAHTYTGYPMVRQMREMIAQNAIGPVQKIDVQYYQGWINPIIHDPSQWPKVWRLDPKLAGPSCCIGDIGVHAFNLVEYTTGLTVDRVLSALDGLHPDNVLDVDATVLLRMSNGVRGVLRASQIATGEENRLHIAVYGRSGGLKWLQEEPNRLEWLREDQPIAVLKPGHAYDAPAAQAASKLPPGHPEGFIDAMGNLYRGVARAVRGEAVAAGDYPGIEDGVRGMCFLEAVLQSSREANRWVLL